MTSITVIYILITVGAGVGAIAIFATFCWVAGIVVRAAYRAARRRRDTRLARHVQAALDAHLGRRLADGPTMLLPRSPDRPTQLIHLDDSQARLMADAYINREHP